MKDNDDIPITDTTEIKQLINRVKQGEFDQGDALLIEKLLNILLTIVSLLQRKHTSIRRVKEIVSFQRAVRIFIINMPRQLAESSRN
jgi:hypothetical protein